MSPNEARILWHGTAAAEPIGSVTRVSYEHGRLVATLTVNASGLADALATAIAASESLHTALGGLSVLVEPEARRWVHSRRGRGPAFPLWRRIGAIAAAKHVIADEARHAAETAAAERLIDLTSADGPYFVVGEFKPSAFARGWYCTNCGRYNHASTAHCWRCGNPSPTT